MEKSDNSMSYEYLHGLYEDLLRIRSLCGEHMANFIKHLQEGQLVDETAAKQLMDDLMSVCSSQTNLCEAMRSIGISDVSNIKGIKEKIQEWKEREEQDALREKILVRLRRVLDIQYTKDDDDIANVLQQIKEDVKNLLALSLSFEELAKRTEVYFDFLTVVESPGPDHRDLDKKIMDAFGANFGLACAYRDFQLIDTIPKNDVVPNSESNPVSIGELGFPSAPENKPEPEVQLPENLAKAQFTCDLEIITQNPIRNRLTGSSKRFIKNIDEMAHSVYGRSCLRMLLQYTSSKPAVCDYLINTICNLADRQMAEQKIKTDPKTAREEFDQGFAKLEDWGVIDEYRVHGVNIYTLSDAGREIISQPMVKKYLALKEFDANPYGPFDRQHFLIATALSFCMALIFDIINQYGLTNEKETPYICRVESNDNPDQTLTILAPYFVGFPAKDVLNVLQDLKSSDETVIVIAEDGNMARTWLDYFDGKAFAYRFDLEDTDTPFMMADGTLLSHGEIFHKNEDQEDNEKIKNIENQPVNEEKIKDDIQDEPTKESVKKSTITDKSPDTSENPGNFDQRDVIIESVPPRENTPEDDAYNVGNDDVYRSDLSAQLMHISDLFCQGHTAEAMALLHVLNHNFKNEKGIAELCDEVGYIIDDPLQEDHFDNSGFSFWDSMLAIDGFDMGRVRDYLNAIAMVKCFYHPDPKDYRVKKYWNQVSNDDTNTAFKIIPELKQLISLFHNFAENTGVPFAACYSQQLRQQKALDALGKAIMAQLDIQKQAIYNNLHGSNHHPRLYGVIQKLYDVKDGIVYRYFDDIQSYDIKEIQTFCESYLIKPLSVDTALPLSIEIIDDKKVEDYLKELWMTIEVGSRRNQTFIGKDLTKQKNALKKSVFVLAEYVLYTMKCNATSYNQTVSVDVSAKQKNRALALLNEIHHKFIKLPVSTAMDRLAISVLAIFLDDFSDTLKEIDSASRKHFYETFLLTNHIELNNDYLPILAMDFGIRQDDMQIQVEEHLNDVSQKKDKIVWQDVYNEALRHWNFGHMELIANAYPDQVEIRADLKSLESRGLSYFEEDEENFRSDVELAANYGKIAGKNEIERYLSVAERSKKHFKETRNYGMYGDFLDICRQAINEGASAHHDEMQHTFDRFVENLKSQVNSNDDEEQMDISCVNTIQKWLDENNLTVVEDYLNRCNGKSLAEVQAILSHTPGTDIQTLTDFITHYQDIYDKCNRNKSFMLNKIYDAMLNVSDGSRKRVNRKQRDAQDFIRCWVNARRGKEIEAFLSQLFNGTPKILDQRSNETKNRIFYKAKFTDDGSSTVFTHTFAMFGSYVYKRGIQLIIFTGNHTPQSIVNEINNSGITRDMGTIVLLDSALTLAERRDLARLMKLDVNMANVLILDWVMALYLTNFEKNERFNKMLEVALPFAYVQPFVTENILSPEMFVGRSEELKELEDFAGPVFVYGGRQLGKSALLRQTRYRLNHPEKGSYAIFIDIKTKDEKQTLIDICEEFINNGILNAAVSTWEDLGRALRHLFATNHSGKVEKLMLLLDEADAFLVSCKDVNNRPIEILKNIRDASDGRFKFVLAGLHNVIRFDREQLGGNSVFAQLGHIVIKPFDYLEASELLLKPLNYLGFEIQKPDIVSTILSKTNYFPGLIQFYGKKLVSAVRDNYRNNTFSQVNTPPYLLNDQYLKDLLKDNDFLQNIEDKLNITLELDKDNYYYIIALVVAYYYHYNECTTPVTADMIKEICENYGIMRLAAMDTEKVQALIDEMVELNILHLVSDDTGYIFNRYNFFTMLGSWEDVAEKLETYADEKVE